jgi:hypothetical protein
MKNIFITFSILIVGCGSDIKEIKKYTKQDAVAQSHVFVKEKLTSPGSAEFPYQSDETIDQINDSTFKVLSYVDSQNKFGALLRTYYKCTIVFFPKTEMATCNDMLMESN